MRETRVRFLGWEDLLEKEMAIHSSPLAWKIPWTEEPDRLQSMGSQRVGHDWATSRFSRIISWLQSPSAVILEPKKIKSVTVSIVSPSICHEVMGLDVMILVFECWVVSQLFQSPLSSSSRESFVLLCLLPLGWYYLHIRDCWHFSQQCWFQLVLHPIQHFSWCTLQMIQISRVTIYSLDVFLSQFGTSLLFHVWF